MDLISKQTIIDRLDYVIENGASDSNGLHPLSAEVVRDMVEQLPPAEPHWIPVTERLPETTDAVLTTYIVNGDRSRKYVEESSYYGNDESWSSPWDEYRLAGTSIEVIAWMPLMKPWNGEVTE
jgi:hypothetical protein